MISCNALSTLGISQRLGQRLLSGVILVHSLSTCRQRILVQLTVLLTLFAGTPVPYTTNDRCNHHQRSNHRDDNNFGLLLAALAAARHLCRAVSLRLLHRLRVLFNGTEIDVQIVCGTITLWLGFRNRREKRQRRIIILLRRLSTFRSIRCRKSHRRSSRRIGRGRGTAISIRRPRSGPFQYFVKAGECRLRAIRNSTSTVAVTRRSAAYVLVKRDGRYVPEGIDDIATSRR